MRRSSSFVASIRMEAASKQRAPNAGCSVAGMDESLLPHSRVPECRYSMHAIHPHGDRKPTNCTINQQNPQTTKNPMLTNLQQFSLANLLKGVAGVSALVAASLIVPTSTAFSDEYEWDPEHGYHEEEWYDPSDWFDADTGIDYESDYYGNYYDGGYSGYSDDYDEYDRDTTSWYGDNYYTDDWYEDESRFDSWYSDESY